MYPYGLIGNCQISALVNLNGSIDWLCLPRPDSPPVFGRLLDPRGGHFSVETSGKSHGHQTYLSNTVVLKTLVTTEDDDQFEILDFCPRFQQHGRTYRPVSLFRIVRPVKGSPMIRIRCHPVDGWSKEPVQPVRGNSHLRYDIQGESLRLVTNMPLTYLCEESEFLLKDTIYLGLTWGLGIEDDLADVSERFLNSTIQYWEAWVKHCSIPSLYQNETIRSALTLKLHCYEDTGAILAALTTSLPEEEGQTRNWDYRFCWLRDAYFALSAFHSLGHFEEMEGFLKFLINIAEKHEDSKNRLRPVYRLDQSLPLPEIEHLNWAGYKNSSPVRSNNQAAEHIQNDVYGEMALTLSPIFLDQRFQHLRTKDHERLLSRMGSFCAQYISKSDAGLWEIRNGWQEHTFSNLMCWAGLDRIQKIKRLGFLQDIDFDLDRAAKSAFEAVHASVMEGSLRNGPKDPSFDSALLQASILRFPDKPVVQQTVSRIAEELRLSPDPELSNYLYRYLRTDDFGRPQSAFLICSYWLVQALAKSGQMDKAQSVMKAVMASENHLGLLSEHFSPNLKAQTGNFPQAYSHVGQINAAFAISPAWSDIL